MELLFVHLTDIHIKDEMDFNVLIKRTESLSKAIIFHITDMENTMVFLCVTGDLTYSGSAEQFTYGELFLEKITELIQKRYRDISVQIVIIPGNHDCDFNHRFASTRDLLLKGMKVSEVTTPEIMESYTMIQNEYFDYTEKIYKKGIGFGCHKDKMLTENVLEDETREVFLRFHCINTAWCSSKHEQKGKIGFAICNEYEKREKDIIITMLHHDSSWFDWESMENWKKYCQKYSDVILVGHDHIVEYVHKTNYNTASNYVIKGNQLYDSLNPDQSGFNILKIDNKSRIQNFFTYEWKDGNYINVIDTKGMPFIKNKFYQTGIELKEVVKGFLEDMDVDIYSMHKENLCLSEVFVYPTLRGKTGNNKRNIHYRDENVILETIKSKRKIIISGEKEYGKTALLKRLFMRFYERGKLPVWIDVLKISSADGEMLNSKIKSLYIDTYDNICADEVMQMDAEKKVCIIDNFDEVTLSDKSIKRLLQYLSDKFGIVILSTTPSRKMANFLKNIEANNYMEEKFYDLQICNLGNYGKRELVNKWLLLANSEQDEDSVQFDNARKEKLLQAETVMKTGFFHQTPIEFLLVLSYLENTSRMNTDYSRYSYVYDCLIKEKINKMSNSDTNDAVMYQTILEQLAYKMYNQKQERGVEESFLTTVIYDYNQEYTGAKGEVIDTVKRFENGRLIIKAKSGYRFKYDYMLYYFASGYIINQLSPDERSGIIQELLKDVTKTINYNILLFLSFGLNAEYELLPRLLDACKLVMPEYAGFKFEDQRKLLKDLEQDLESRAENIFAIPRNKDISEIQKRNAIISDMIEEEIEKDEGDKSQEEMDKMMFDLLQMLRLTELLGDIIKNYAGRLKRHPRLCIIDEMHESFLKVMGSMVSSMEFVVGKIMKMAEEKQREGDEDYIIKSELVIGMKKIFYELWRMYVIGCVRNLSTKIECDRIEKEVLDYNAETNSDFFRMVTVEFLINTRKGILPVKEITNCFQGKDSMGAFSQSVLKEIIANDLCCHQFEPTLKQTVCDLLGFDIKEMRIETQKNLVLQDA